MPERLQFREHDRSPMVLLRAGPSCFRQFLQPAGIV